MIRKNKTAVIFLFLGLFFALVSLPDSGAINRGRILREVTATVSDDTAAVLMLEGLEGDRLYNLSNKFSYVGSFTNQTHQRLHITISIKPYFLYSSKKNTKFDIRVGNEIRYFNLDQDQPQQVILMLEPGQRTDIFAALSNNADAFIVTSFDFMAQDDTGRFRVQLNDSLKTPRRFISY